MDFRDPCYDFATFDFAAFRESLIQLGSVFWKRKIPILLRQHVWHWGLVCWLFTIAVFLFSTKKGKTMKKDGP